MPYGFNEDKSKYDLNNFDDLVKIQIFRAVNQTCAAGGTTTASIPITVPDGYKFVGITDAWEDSTGTTSPANNTKVIASNHWGSNPVNVLYVNLGTGAAKFTANVSVLFIKDIFN